MQLSSLVGYPLLRMGLKLAQALVAQGDEGDAQGYDNAACNQCVGRAEVLCRDPRDEIAYGHSAYEREYEHAHDAPAHLVCNELLQEHIDDRHARDNRKAHPEDKC